MKGKNKCKILKQIRQRIAEENEIPYVTRECTYQGACKGTCPTCEAELRYLEAELEKRRRLGKAVAVAAVAAGLSVSLTACTPKEAPGAGNTAPTLPEPNAGLGVEGEDPLLPQQTEIAYTLAGEVEYSLPEESPLAGRLLPQDTLPPEEDPEDEPVLMGDVAYMPEDTEERSEDD